ncbi:NADPH-dependent diflavin oxidoreductase 1 [Lucilia sericata]|uniref:NADPH-dependent diflavin oxidoreductase 1 n=1 Tax=Lucilia sericata TaxID=13632 RepID=UPI0018A88345|nr:NADPH-dependent diflavin oxidoreductase 1 [Lucilia sericata]
MHLLILYGSQTGTAQDVAEQLWRSSKKYGFQGPVLPMDEFPIHKLVEQTLVLFVVATTGDGDEPDNMRNSWKFLLRRSLPSNSLENMQFACLGLGDSSYGKFNYAAKKLNKRLQQLGAKQIIPLGLCDDQHDHGLSAVALPWMDQLWRQLQQNIDINAKTMNGLENAASVFRWQCKKLNERKEGLINNEDNEQILWPYKDVPEKFTLKSNKRTTDPSHFQDVRLLEFVTSDSINWSPGDIIQVQPHNSPKQVEDFFLWAQEHKLDFTADTLVEISSIHDDMPLPKCYSKPLTVEQMVTYLWDLSFRPRQRAFELLALNCEDELEKEKLLEFTTAEGLDDLINYINRPRRTILEVLQDFRHASSKLSLNVLIELFTFIQPRSFSIASCKESGQLDLLVAVVEYKTKLSTPRQGLCSNWLKNLKPDTQIYGCIKSGTMKLPKDISTPLIVVGPGTGIAPFRSIIQSLYINKSDSLPPALFVFFGCRNSNKDFHFQEDLQKWQSEKCISLYCAFSRDQDNKIYVQHLIEENADKLKPLIMQKGAFIFVSGSSKNMPKSVKEAFTKVVDNNDALIEQLIKTKRYQEETWS